MSSQLHRFYQTCSPQVRAALGTIVGSPLAVVRDESIFKTLVIDAGWQTLPPQAQNVGREALRWDELLRTLRTEVYQADNGKIALKPDAEARLQAVLQRLFGAPAAPPPPPPPPPPSVPVAAPVAVAPAAPPTLPAPGTTAPAKKATGAAIGIDLGTTYSAVAHVDTHGRPYTIQNSNGDLTTPSVILFDGTTTVVGKEAVMAAAMEPDQVASCVKRDMGARNFRKRINGKQFPPEVLSSIILRRLKEDAEAKVGPVGKAVITVPAYFDESRRRATFDAGHLAGLEVLGIINEPTAAALAYGYQIGFLDQSAKVVGDKPLTTLVYDLGGGTFDVTIIRIHGRSFQALATDGDVSLGGKDWDEKLVEVIANRLRAELREDPRDNPSTLEELRLAAEGAKKTLTERQKATVYINHLGSRHKVEVTRQEFEEGTAGLLGRTRTTTEIVLRQAGMRVADLDNILLVGGSTRMPMVRQMLQELSGKAPEQSVSPDEAVAHGAALYAHLLDNKEGKLDSEPDFTIADVNSHSLGLVGIDTTTGRKKNQILIPKNTPLPHSVVGTFKTNKANQANVLIRIVEGESERPEACMQLGTCKIAPLPPNLPAGWPIYVRYSYLADGQVEVSAKVKGQEKAVTVALQRENNLTPEEVDVWMRYIQESS